MNEEMAVAYAEPAYRNRSYAEHAYDSREPRNLRVTRTGTSEQSATSLLVTIAKMAAIVLVVVTALAFARIALTNAAVVTMIESDAISSQIADARTTGVSLEMEQSVLSNTSAIKAAAKRLGMATPYEVESIILSPDVVATTSDGALSLSGTVGKLVETQG